MTKIEWIKQNATIAISEFILDNNKENEFIQLEFSSNIKKTKLPILAYLSRSRNNYRFDVWQNSSFKTYKLSRKELFDILRKIQFMIKDQKFTLTSIINKLIIS